MTEVLRWWTAIGLGRNLWTKLAGLFFLGSLCAAGFQFITTKVDESRYPPPGTLIDVGGYRLHAKISGEGDVTVIFDAGLGDSLLVWALVEPEIARFARVLTYDRAGLGWSDSGRTPRTSEQIVGELRTLLTKSEIKGRYVLVGHSFGGINALLYASKYPNEIAGLVLVDSLHEEQLERFPDPPLIRKFLFKAVMLAAPFGLPRIRSLLGLADSTTPASVRDIHQAVSNRTKHLFTVYDEFSAMENAVVPPGSQRPFFGDIPLVVLTAGNPKRPDWVSEAQFEKIKQVWQVQQQDLASRSNHSSHMIAHKSDHYIQYDQPELVIEAVRRIINASKN